MYSYMDVYHLKLIWATATKYKQNKDSSVFTSFIILTEAVWCFGKNIERRKGYGVYL